MEGHRLLVRWTLVAALTASAGCGGEPGGGRGGAGAAGQGGRGDPTTGDGGSGSGKSSASGQAGGSSASDGSGGRSGSSDWGCADDGSTCLCYEPGGQGYDDPSCGHYDCCWYAEYPQGNECECVKTSSCTRTNPDAKRVSSCPP
jgi:hypothetical protein